MIYVLIGLALALLLFAGMLGCLEWGRRRGARLLERSPSEGTGGTGPLEAAVFGMLGLLIAFTFGGAVSRFDTRRELIVAEANAVGTFWLRIDLLPGPAQEGVRDLTRRYTDARLEAYALLPDFDAAKAGLERAASLQGVLWAATVQALRDAGPAAPSVLLVNPLNELFDLATKRVESAKKHPPVIIYGMLFVIALGSALMAGYGMARSRDRSWFHRIAFAGVTALAFYVTLDFEFPRLGLIRLNAADQVLMDARAAMR